MGWIPPPPPPLPSEVARQAVINAKRARAHRRMRALYAREPWRDPASESYDPLRVMREGKGNR